MIPSLEIAVDHIGIQKSFSLSDSFKNDLGARINERYDSYRNRSFPPEVVLSGMMHQVLTDRGSLSTTLAKINADRFAMGLEPVSSNTGAFARARSRLPTDLIIDLARGQYSGIKKSEFIDEWLWKGFELKVIDGTTFSVADTDENRKLYPQHGMQSEGAGHPLLRAVVLQSISTGLIQDANFGAYKGKSTGEMSLAKPLIEQLTAGDLLLGDRYYPSFFVVAKLQRQLAHGVFQSHSQRRVDFRRGKSLGSKDHIVSWPKPPRPSDMSKEEYSSYPDEITVRETCLSVNKQALILVSTLLDADKYSPEDLELLYKKRWFVELALRDIKSFFGLEHINAKTPEMVAKEFWIHILTYNYVRWYMANAAVLAQSEVDTISFQLTVKTVMSNEWNALHSDDEQLDKLQKLIMATLISHQIRKRPGRKEPRAVKKRPKPHKRLKVPRKQWHSGLTA